MSASPQSTSIRRRAARVIHVAVAIAGTVHQWGGIDGIVGARVEDDGGVVVTIVLGAFKEGIVIAVTGRAGPEVEMNVLVLAVGAGVFDDEVFLETLAEGTKMLVSVFDFFAPSLGDGDGA